MKKLTLFAVVSLLSVSLFAQETKIKVESDETKIKTDFDQDRTGFHFGVHISPMVTWLNPGAGGEYDLRRVGKEQGLAYGMMLEYNFTNAISVVTGANFAYQGGELYYADSIADMERRPDYFNENIVDYNLGYLEVPLALKYRIGDDDLNYWIQAGGYMGWLMKGKADIYSASGVKMFEDVIIRDTNVGPDNKDVINKSNAGALFGIGMDAPFLSEMRFTTGVTYHMGMTNVNNFDRDEATLRNVRINFGIIF